MTAAKIAPVLDLVLFLAAVAAGAVTGRVASRRGEGAGGATPRMRRFATMGLVVIGFDVSIELAAVIGIIPNIPLRTGAAFLTLTAGFILSYAAIRVLHADEQPTQHEGILLTGLGGFAVFVNLYYAGIALIGAVLL